jgi:YidC/Oxa1 family membrane protein insertase
MPNHNLGLAIIVLTIIMRLAFLPSSLKQGVSQEKLRLLQPKIKAIQDKYKNDRTAQSKAVMDIYKQAGTSPFGACLPLIVQIVILIMLYRVFQIGLSTARFDLLYSWVPRPSNINISFFGINLSKPDLWILPIITGILQFVQSKLTMPPKAKKGAADDNPMMAATSQMLYIFPVLTVIIARKLPAALPVYWLTTSLFMIIQQIYINRVLKPKAVAHLDTINFDDAPATDSKVIQDQKSLPAGDSKPDKIVSKSDAIATPGRGVTVNIRKRGK